MNLDSKIYVPDDQQTGDTSGDSVKQRENKESEQNSMWSFSYYQRFFEITTDQVLTRLVWSMFPKPGINYFKDFIQANPDLYGPIWISLTLIFTVTMSGNLGSYLQLASNSEANFSWKYDFHLISLAATCILSYCWLLPLVLWGFMKWNSSEQVEVSYLDLTCVYGYCVTIFIPISILWVIQINWLQWFLACMGTLLSGTVLIKSLMPLMSFKNYIFVVAILSCHFLLSLSLLWNCFQGSLPKNTVSLQTTTTNY